MSKTPAKDEPENTDEHAVTGESTVVNVGGVEYTIPAEARDDFELLDDLIQLEESGSAVRMPQILRRLIGAEQARRAMDTLRDPQTGRVTIEAGTEFVHQILAAANPN